MIFILENIKVGIAHPVKLSGLIHKLDQTIFVQIVVDLFKWRKKKHTSLRPVNMLIA